MVQPPAMVAAVQAPAEPRPGPSRVSPRSQLMATPPRIAPGPVYCSAPQSTSSANFPANSGALAHVAASSGSQPPPSPGSASVASLFPPSTSNADAVETVGALRGEIS